MYAFYRAWFLWPLRRLVGNAADEGPGRRVDRALASGLWTPEASYDFWEGVAHGFLLFCVAWFLVLFGALLALRPTGEAEAIGLFAVRAWGGFFATGVALVEVPYFHVWYRKRAGRVLPPRTNGAWMLLVQVPIAIAFAFAAS